MNRSKNLVAGIQGMKRHTIGKEVITLGESKMPHIRLPENLGIRYAVLPGDPALA